jgi:hypothetical protein
VPLGSRAIEKHVFFTSMRILVLDHNRAGPFSGAVIAPMMTLPDSISRRN